jgi:hypothetical protein
MEPYDVFRLHNDTGKFVLVSDPEGTLNILVAVAETISFIKKADGSWIYQNGF